MSYELNVDEIYVQEIEDHSLRDSIGADKNEKLYKEFVYFMIVGLKENIPFVIKTSPEIEVNGEWINMRLSTA